MYKKLLIIFAGLILIACQNKPSQLTEQDIDAVLLNEIAMMEQAIDDVIMFEKDSASLLDDIGFTMLQFDEAIVDQVKDRETMGIVGRQYIAVIDLQGASQKQPISLRSFISLESQAKSSIKKNISTTSRENFGDVKLTDFTLSQIFEDDANYTVFSKRLLRAEKFYDEALKAFNTDNPVDLTIYRRFDFKKENDQYMMTNYDVQRDFYHQEMQAAGYQPIDKRTKSFFRVGDQVFE